VDFEWEPDRNKRNVRRRGIDFAWAIEIFHGDVIEWIDSRRYGEDRWITIGEVDGVVLTLVSIWRGTRRRVVSACKAHDRQRKKYRENFPEGKDAPSSE
jgi:uncharacterized protein